MNNEFYIANAKTWSLWINFGICI